LRKSRAVKFSSLRAFVFLGAHQARRHKKSRYLGFSLIAAVLFIIIFTAFSDHPEATWVDGTLRGLSLRQKIAQLVQIRVPGRFINRESPEFLAIRDQIQKNQIGGVVLFAGNIYESAVLLNELQSISKLPLLVAADFERGASFRIEDATSFPWTMAIGATGSEQYAYQQGLITGKESRALGVHWIFAPVVDVNNNPDNPVINIRSFGEDPALVARLGAAFIRGAKKAGVLTTAKHFPGHGDTATDSHLGLAVVESDLARLQALEFAPFRSAIEAGVDSIMTAHVSVPRVTNEPEVPATLSPEILTDLLRNTLKFNGIVVTDALEMAGVTNHYWCGLAAIRAIQAGADVLLLPPNATVAINEVERAVRRGDISESRIDQSVRRLLTAKASLGLQRNRLVPIDRIGETVSSPQNTNLAQEIADHSITVLKDERHLLPINPLNETKIFSLVLSPDLDNSPGSVFQNEMRKRFPSIRTAWCNARIPSELMTYIDGAVSGSDLIVCSTMVRLNSRPEALSIPASQRRILKRLVASRKPVVWVTFGNPYVLGLAPKIGTYVCAFSYSDVSQIAAAKAVAGEIEINGRMPVSIPPYSKAGDGLKIAKLKMTLEPEAPDLLRLSENTLEQTKQLLASLIESGVFPGADLLVGYQNRIAMEYATGGVSYSKDSAKVAPDTAYDLDSLSRIVGTASAVMLAEDSRSLMLEDLVKNYLPEIARPERESLRIQDLLKDLFASSRSEPKLGGIYEKLLNEIASRATGMPLGPLLHDHLFEPLGMKSALFNPPANDDSGTVFSATPESIRLFCNAHDLAKFAQMILNRGIYNHRRLFQSDTIERFTGPQGPWSKPLDAGLSGKFFSSSAFGHNCSGGSFLWLDPAKKLFIVFLANGPPEDERIQGAQKRIAESVVSAIHN
jgi:beta-N-acetylhexosaminidase